MTRVLRSLSRNPGLLATAVLLLALGIGATTALFSVIHGVLLAPLPYQEPERLGWIWTELEARGVPHFPVSPGDLEDFRSQSTLFADIGGINTGNATFTHAGGELRHRGLLLASTGIVLGLAAAFALSHSLSALLVNITPTDPATYAAITALFVAIAATASALPALAAARVQPMAVLRDE